MFFEQLSDLPKITSHNNCAIFMVNPNLKLDLKTALYLRPDESKKTDIITTEQIRDFINFSTNRESTDRFFVIAPADTMSEAAQNAFLKTFEEPQTFCHYILLTEKPTALLPTILSRAPIYIPKTTGKLDAPPSAKPKLIEQAKKLISAKPLDLPAIANDISKNKTKPRQLALDVTATAIELLYKSYFKTGNTKFLTKLPDFLNLYQNLEKNGHIKLHIVADLC